MRLSIDRRDLSAVCPKCDEDLIRAKARKPQVIDLAHRGETVSQALAKLDAAVPPFAQGHDPDQIRDADKPGQAHFADNPRVGYWHDFGHGQIKHNLGLLDHVEWLEMILPHLVGCHVHDVQWPARDHRTPFSGVLDYSELLPFLPKNCPLVRGLSSSRGAREIREALLRRKNDFSDRA